MMNDNAEGDDEIVIQIDDNNLCILIILSWPMINNNMIFINFYLNNISIIIYYNNIIIILKLDISSFIYIIDL